MRGGTGLISLSLLSRMRFDRDDGRPIPPKAKLPESMLPKSVAPDFTPFPLPKYDDSLGHGPVRLSNIPDVEESKRRMTRASSSSFTPHVTLLEEEELNTREGQPPQSMALDTTQGTSMTAQKSSLQKGYHVDPKYFPTVDRLVCSRETEDLIRQFQSRTDTLSRTATVLDFASSFGIRSDEELQRILYECSSLFSPDGYGLNFIKNVVVKFGRGYTVNTELTTAFTELVNSMETFFVEEQSQRLLNPALFASVLNFLSLIKVLEPNKWYTANPNTPSNRADYSHPTGINRNAAHRRTGEELFDFMTMLIVNDHATGGGGGVFLAQCTLPLLIDLLGGFAAVSRDGFPEGEVKNILLHTIDERLKEKDYTIATEEEVRELERLYMTLSLCEIQEPGLLHFLLADNERFPHTKLKYAEGADKIQRGPSFFSAVSHCKDASVKYRASELLRESFLSAQQGNRWEDLSALVESGSELLMSLPDKQKAAELMTELEFDYYSLATLQDFKAVAERYRVEHQKWAKKRLEVTPLLVRTQLKVNQLPQLVYVSFYENRRVRPIRTFLTDLGRLNEMDNVFILHSSIFAKYVDQLVSAVKRLRSGKDALIVTASCLRSITVKSQYGRREQERKAAQRALEIIAFELDQGTITLLPPTEEVLLHDAGVYCDEDLLLWTLAAYFAREMPLLKVHALISEKSTAIRPQHWLKGEHSVSTKTNDLYHHDRPLLSALPSRELRSVTHLVHLQRPVKDRRMRLYENNPTRRRFLYRRDKAMFDKYHTTARHVAPGFSEGSLVNDTRGLGFFTPDYPQVPYRKIPFLEPHIKKYTTE